MPIDTAKRAAWGRVIAPRFDRACEQMNLTLNGATSRYDADPALLREKIADLQAHLDGIRLAYDLPNPIEPQRAPERPTAAPERKPDTEAATRINGTLGRSYAAWALARLRDGDKAEAIEFLVKGLEYEGQGR